MLQTTTTMEEVMTTVKPRLGVTLLMREPMVTITCSHHISTAQYLHHNLSPSRRSRRGPVRCQGRPRPGCRTRGSPCRSPGGGGRCARWSPGGLGPTRWLVRMTWAQQCLEQTITRDFNLSYRTHRYSCPHRWTRGTAPRSRPPESAGGGTPA